MTNIDGQWRCVQQSPMGEKTSTLNLHTIAEGRFGGTNVNDDGSLEFFDGEIDGNKVKFKLKLTKPLPTLLKTEAVLIGDVFEGETTIGIFGRYSIKATRTR